MVFVSRMGHISIMKFIEQKQMELWLLTLTVTWSIACGTPRAIHKPHLNSSLLDQTVRAVMPALT